jgi:hypothetical protein
VCIPVSNVSIKVFMFRMRYFSKKLVWMGRVDCMYCPSAVRLDVPGCGFFLVNFFFELDKSVIISFV